MAAYARLKNEFTEDEKYHNLMRWLIYTEPKIFMLSSILVNYNSVLAETVDWFKLKRLGKDIAWYFVPWPGVPMDRF